MDSSRCSSACSGMRDWMNSRASAGSMPHASQSITMSSTVSEMTIAIFVMGGQRMPVRHEEIAFVLVLELDPVHENAAIVTEVEPPGGAACPKGRAADDGGTVAKVATPGGDANECTV